MKITEINSDELQIDDKNLRALIGGLLFASVGTALGVYGYVEVTPGVPSWIGAAFGSIFVFGGLVMLFNAESRHVVLRRLGVSEIVMKKLITKKITTTTFTTDQVASVNYETHMEYERTTDSDGRTRDKEERVSTVWVQLKDGRELTLASKRGSSGIAINGMSVSGLGRTPLYDEAARIASFYNVPLQTNTRNLDPVSGLAQVIATVKQGMSTAPTQPSAAVQPSQSPTLAAAPQPVPMAAPLSVQPVGQESGLSSTVVAGGVAPPMTPVAPGAVSATPQQAPTDNPQQLPPQN